MGWRSSSLLLAVAMVAGLGAQESVRLAKPQPSTTAYTVEQIFLTWPNSNDPNTCQISVTLRSNIASPLPFSHAWSGPPACMLLKTINRTDFSKESLQRRILAQLLSDKVLDGKIEGAPEP